MRLLKATGIIAGIVGIVLVLSAIAPAAKLATVDHPLNITALTVEGQADSVLESAWSTKVYQNERAYCGSWTMRGTTLVIFYAAPAPFTRGVSWNTISFQCPQGFISIHTHPPQDCNPTGTYCAATTWREAECAGSAQDQLSQLGASPPFGVVQCGRNVFGLFFAPQFLPPIHS